MQLINLASAPVYDDFNAGITKGSFLSDTEDQANRIAENTDLFNQHLQSFPTDNILLQLKQILGISQNDITLDTIIQAIKDKKRKTYETLEKLTSEKMNAVNTIRAEAAALENERARLGFFKGRRKKEINAILSQIPFRIQQVEAEYDEKIKKFK